jgi:DNA-binding NtrC family response regulator
MLPPLRERHDCIPLLVRHFLVKFREKLGRKIHNISDQAMGALVRYSWPGNVRELRHVIERACVLCTGSTLLREHFPAEMLDTVPIMGGAKTAEPVGKRVREAHKPAVDHLSEEELIRQTMLQVGGNKSKAAKLLDFDRSTLYRKMRRYQIS